MSSSTSSHRHPAEAESGPSGSGSGSGSSSATRFPRWPDREDEAEYWEIPPEHFLAQQGHQSQEDKIVALERQRLRERRRESIQYQLQQQQQQRERDISPTCSTSSKDSFVTAYHHESSSPDLQPSPDQSNLNFDHQHQHHANPMDALADHLPDFVGLTSITNQQQNPSALPDTTTLAAADFDVDVRSGFLPPQQPIQRLRSDLPEVKWEEMLETARALPLKIGGGGKSCGEDQRRLNRRWRRDIRAMEVISPSPLLRSDIKYARRAHLVLSFLAHFYIHSQPAPTKRSSSSNPPSFSSRLSWRGYFSTSASSGSALKNGANTSWEEMDRLDSEAESQGLYASTIPASISIPFMSLSNQLGLPPVLTYSTTVLWNWSLPNPNLPLSPTNYSIPMTFTNTKDEEHFYATSLLIEMKGVEALKLMRVSLDEAFLGDNLARKRISYNLKKLSLVIKELAVLIEEVKKECNPEVFYWGIRPWFRGGDSDPTTDVDSAKGWHYEGVDPVGVKRNFGGPSAGQSSLIHSIDVFLDVDHTRTKVRVGDENKQGEEKKKGEDVTFMSRMLDYMPAPHRAFLNHLRELSFDEDEHDIKRLGKESSDEGEGEGEGEEHSKPTSHPIRSLALTSPTSPARSKFSPFNPHPPKDDLRESYDEALKALKSMRDAHMRVVASYIVRPSRGQPSIEYAPLPAEFTGHQAPADTRQKTNPDGKRRMVDSGYDEREREKSERRRIKKLKNEEKLRSKLNAAAAPEQDPERDGDGDGDGDGKEDGNKQKGTGGTNLISFLKDCVSNTTDAMLGSESESN